MVSQIERVGAPLKVLITLDPVPDKPGLVMMSSGRPSPVKVTVGTTITAEVIAQKIHADFLCHPAIQLTDMGERVSVPTILQHAPSESGACALGMILAHYDLRLPRYQLLAACSVHVSAANPAPLLLAAQSFNLEGSVLKMGAEAALQLPMPAIVLLDQNMFAVLEGVEDGKIYLNLPSDGPSKSIQPNSRNALREP
jgi:hypothetical protein